MAVTNLATGNPFKDSLTDEDPPSAKVINWFLSNADSRAVGSMLHPIGFTDGAVASGQHKHDGKDSPYLFDTTPILTDLPASPTTAQIVQAVNAINQHLRARGAGVSAS